MNGERMAIVDVSLPVLAGLLELPAGCEIEAAFYDPAVPHMLRLRLRGAGWVPTHDAFVIPNAWATVRLGRMVVGVRPEITWDLPT